MGVAPRVPAAVPTAHWHARLLALRARCATTAQMDLDDLLLRYFGTADPAEASPAVLETAIDRIRVDFGLEPDRGRRFALWSVLYLLGHAPDLDVAFKDEADREAARNLMDMLAGG